MLLIFTLYDHQNNEIRASLALELFVLQSKKTHENLRISFFVVSRHPKSYPGIQKQQKEYKSAHAPYKYPTQDDCGLCVPFYSL